MRAKFIYEKFTVDSDPIHDMNIGPQGKVYICDECGVFCDENGYEIFEEEDIERAEAIYKIFKDKKDRVEHILCVLCYEDQIHRQQEYEWEQEQEAEARQRWEDQQRWEEENRPYY